MSEMPWSQEWEGDPVLYSPRGVYKKEILFDGAQWCVDGVHCDMPGYAIKFAEEALREAYGAAVKEGFTSVPFVPITGGCPKSGSLPLSAEDIRASLVKIESCGAPESRRGAPDPSDVMG